MFRFTAINYLACVTAMLPVAAQAQQDDGTTQTLREPITAILDAFRTHEIVAIGEGLHGNEQGHALRMDLIRDPRFAATVDDIVVEVGNSMYQALIDDYVNGEDVPISELRNVWENTTQIGGVTDAPIYADIFRVVRSVNAGLPSDRRLRVLLGDPPIDWDEVLRGNSSPPSGRDSFTAELIEREVLAKQRRALVIFGSVHLRRRNSSVLPAEAPAFPPSYNLVQLLNRDNDVNIFSVTTNVTTDLSEFAPSAAEWAVPTLALLAGTELGATPFKDYVADKPLARFKDGKVYMVETDPSIRLQDQFDALLYIGPPDSMTFSDIPAERCADPAYIQTRVERIEYMTSRTGIRIRMPVGEAGGRKINLPAGFEVDPVTRFKERCAKCLERAAANLR